MFTGIIQDVGRIEQIIREPQQTHMTFQTHLDTHNWQLGDSIAVDGCCLTITAIPQQDLWSATLSEETLQLTHFSDALVGQSVNLEPALCVGDALGGHIVTGHIDGMARLIEKEAIGEHYKYVFEAPESLAKYIVSKGSIAINGVSLTVNSVEHLRFTLNLIPHTLSVTTLSKLETGMQVNLETDMLGRYVERLLSFQ